VDSPVGAAWGSAGCGVACVRLSLIPGVWGRLGPHIEYELFKTYKIIKMITGFLYVMKNQDWVDKYKYGFTTRLERKNDSHEQHSYLSEYKEIYEIIEHDNPYKECDHIISIAGRDIQMIGKLERIYNCNLNKLRSINEFLINDGGGMEFIKSEGAELLDTLIMEEFQLLRIKFSKYSIEHVKEINDNIKIENKQKTINYNQILDDMLQYEKIYPRDYQIDIITKIIEHYKTLDIINIIWACGLGKALLVMFIIQSMRFKTVLIGVPGCRLQYQIKTELLKIFPNESNILCVGGDKGIEASTDALTISNFMNSNKYNKFVITTYTSCHNLLDYNFDFKVGDECHHLAGSGNTKNSFHNIKSSKTFFMTATTRHSEDGYSMGDIEHFGINIDIKTVKWAIENKKITDYYLVIIENSEEDVDYIIKECGIIVENKELFMSAYVALKSMKSYKNLTHLLIYTNKCENATLVNKYISVMLKNNIFNFDSIYYKDLHSKTPSLSLNDEINKYKNSKYGIISCVQILGEGFDLPAINGVVIGEKMESTIRLTQSVLRAHRLNKDLPDKKAYVLLPINNKISWSHCVDTILKLRNDDEDIESRISYCAGNSIKNKKINIENDVYLMETAGDILESIKLRMTWSRLANKQAEYNYYKLLNKIHNIRTQTSYHDLAELLGEFYKKDVDKYFQEFDWHDFLNYDKSKFIKDLYDWKKYCQLNYITTPEEYYKISLIDEKLPLYPSEFYKNFSNFHNELKFKFRKNNI
jgi:superfamily II DNA or RNA helicase